jgi:two-component system chemotaxis sensor kinase CheA
MPDRLETVDDKSLLSEYLSESHELLDSLLADLDALAGRTGPELDTNLVNRIFRGVHSLKGLLGMMGLPDLQSAAHEVEDVLDDIRLGTLVLDEDVKAALVEVGAGFTALVGGAARGSVTEEDLDRFNELIAAIALRPRRVKVAERYRREIDALGLSTAERNMVTDIEAARLAENQRAGRSIFGISTQFKVEQLDTGYRELTSAVAAVGELITTLPDKTESRGAVGLKLLVASRCKESDLKRLLKGRRVRVQRLGGSPWHRAGTALMEAGRKRIRGGRRPDPPPIIKSLPPSFAQESLQPVSPSVRVELFQIDELSGLAHELAIETRRLAAEADQHMTIAGCGAKEMFNLKFGARRIERHFLELEERLVELRMVSLAQTFTRAAKLAGRLARELGKSVTVDTSGRETQIDKVIVDRVADPIYHILRNAIDHGIELPEERRLTGKPARGRIRLEAHLEGTRAVVSVSDDGRGIDPEQVRRRAVEIRAVQSDQRLTDEESLRLIFHPGFSTAGHVSPVSGRGVGLDAVEGAVREMGGFIRLISEMGKGSRFDIVVPTTLVMISAFIVQVGEWPYAINIGQIGELVYIDPREVLGRDGRRTVQWHGEPIPLVELRYLLGLGGARLLSVEGAAEKTEAGDREPRRGGASPNGGMPILVTRAGDLNVAVAVDEFLGQREIIVKSLGSLTRKFKGIVGAVDLEVGEVAIVLDLPSLLLHRSHRM